MTQFRCYALQKLRLRSAGRQLCLNFLVILVCTGGGSAEEPSDHPVPTRFEVDFSLIDHTGKSVTKADYRGRWLLVFFGYTHCPDVCPTTLVDISSVLRRLGDDSSHVQALFITIDPERDDTQTMAGFVGAFGGNIVGLTGSMSAVRQAAASFRAHFRKVEEDRGPDAYLMEHQATIYLLDRRGKLETVFAPGIGPDFIVNTLRRLVEEEARASLGYKGGN